ncbi:MAG: hypothetical protein ACYSWU_04025, partial [Planctomycetota bacterium]
VRRAIVDPPDAAAFLAGVGLEADGDFQRVVYDLLPDCRGFQQRVDVFEEVLQQEGGPVLFVTLSRGVAFPLAVPGVGSQVNRYLGMVFAAPGDVVGNEVVGAGVEEEIDVAGAERFDVSCDEDAVGDILGELLL